MTQAETGELMALISAEHPKFLSTPDPALRLKLWSSALANVPYELGSKAVLQALTESAYEPKLADIVGRVRKFAESERRLIEDRAQILRQMIWMSRENGKDPEPEWLEAYEKLKGYKPLLIGAAEMEDT